MQRQHLLITVACFSGAILCHAALRKGKRKAPGKDLAPEFKAEAVAVQKACDRFETIRSIRSHKEIFERIVKYLPDSKYAEKATALLGKLQ